MTEKSGAAIRQLDEAQVHYVFEPIAWAKQDMRTRLEQMRIVFREEDDPDAAGPAEWAAIELSSGAQFVFQHHYTQPGEPIEVHSPRGDGTPVDRVNELLSALGATMADVEYVSDGWSSARTT